MSRDFNELKQTQFNQGNLVCVGLDPKYDELPEFLRNNRPLGRWTEGDIFHQFSCSMVKATSFLAGFYKFNPVFFLNAENGGMSSLKKSIMYVKGHCPSKPVILDIKAGDSPNTNRMWAQLAFDQLGVDAVTVNFFPESKAMKPFLDRKDKGIFVWCKSSSEGSEKFQNLPVETEWPYQNARMKRYTPIYQHIARTVNDEWNVNGNCGLIVGATYPKELKGARTCAPNLPILVPGWGKQMEEQGKNFSAADIYEAGKDRTGKGLIISASRSFANASSGSDYDMAAAYKVKEVHEQFAQLIRN